MGSPCKSRTLVLPSIGVGKITSVGLKKVCVDINPAAVVTELSDGGSIESVDIVTKDKESIYI
nr:hypothetical protein [cyanobacterium endosymbiont of Rhopalodia gibberula]